MFIYLHGDLVPTITPGVAGKMIVRNGDATSFSIPQSFSDLSPLVAAGIKCDGVTDDTVAMQELLTQIGTTPTTLIFPNSGRCLLSTISFPSNITLDFTQGGSFQIVTGQTVTIAGSIKTIRQQIFFNALANQGTVSFIGNLRIDHWCPEWWGAVKNGSMNDLAALQATTEAADTAGGGTVDLGRGNYNIGAGTWKIANANLQHHINIIGQNPLATTITTTVTGTTPAIYLNKQKYVFLKGFYLHQNGGNGNGVGIIMGGDGCGTQTNGNIVEEIIVDGFNVGIGTSGSPSVGTSSEITFINLQLNNCTTGFNNASFNGLDFTFIQLQMASNGTGINMATAGCNVFGGSSSNNGTDFAFANGGENTIHGFRSEVANLFCSISATAQLHLESVLVQGLANPNSQVAIASSGQLTIEDSFIGGQITINNASTIIKNTAIIDGTNTYTAIVQPNGQGPGFRFVNGGSTGMRFEVSNVKQYTWDGSAAVFVSAWPNGLGYIYAQQGTSSTTAHIIGVTRGPTLAVTNNAIQPSDSIHHVSAGAIQNITATDAYNTKFPQTTVQLIPDAAFTYDNTGNIIGSGTAIIGRLMIACFDPVTAKWYMSY